MGRWRERRPSGGAAVGNRGQRERQREESFFKQPTYYRPFRWPQFTMAAVHDGRRLMSPVQGLVVVGERGAIPDEANQFLGVAFRIIDKEVGNIFGRFPMEFSLLVGRPPK